MRRRARARRPAVAPRTFRRGPDAKPRRVAIRRPPRRPLRGRRSRCRRLRSAAAAALALGLAPDSGSVSAGCGCASAATTTPRPRPAQPRHPAPGAPHRRSGRAPALPSARRSGGSESAGSGLRARPPAGRLASSAAALAASAGAASAAGARPRPASAAGASAPAPRLARSGHRWSRTMRLPMRLGSGCCRRRRLGPLLHPIAERSQDRGEVLAGAADQRGHPDHHGEAARAVEGGRRLDAGRARRARRAPAG